jgi:hypothetical protein
MIMRKAGKYLHILLWLIALHSFIAGCLLILLGNSGISYFGFPEGNQFFQVQGGVFHLVMCVAYILAAKEPSNSKLIILVILAKSIAFTYLLIYYFAVDPIITVLLSGIADGVMAFLVWFLWRTRLEEAEHE